eukprot:gene27910-30967_t
MADLVEAEKWVVYLAAVWDLVWVVMMGYKQADETGEYTVARLANNWVKQK